MKIQTLRSGWAQTHDSRTLTLSLLRIEPRPLPVRTLANAKIPSFLMGFSAESEGFEPPDL